MCDVDYAICEATTQLLETLEKPQFFGGLVASIRKIRECISPAEENVMKL